MDQFLASYPGQASSGGTANLDFYRGKAQMRPEKMIFDEFVRSYGNDWDELEENQSVLRPTHGSADQPECLHSVLAGFTGHGKFDPVQGSSLSVNKVSITSPSP